MIRIFDLQFCERLCNANEISCAKIEENVSMKFRFMQAFLAKAPKNLWDA